MTQQTQYTITELAREFDVTPRAIRFYEDQGLLAPTREGSSGLRRVYSPRDRTRLRLTLRGKRLGFTLSEIRTLLDLYDSPTGTVSQLLAFLDTIAATGGPGRHARRARPVRATRARAAFSKR
jgi:DNA-binding transcriptional MerR regulator